MDEVLPTMQALARRLGANGYPFTAQHAREITLACLADRAGWVTELQVSVDAQSSSAI